MQVNKPVVRRIHDTIYWRAQSKMEDFNDDFIKTLLDLKKRYNCLIWEDRKFSDIGYITEQQLNYGIHLSMNYN